MTEHAGAKGKRSGPAGRNTRGRHRSNAIPREAETFRPFSPPCRRAHPPGPERLPRRYPCPCSAKSWSRQYRMHHPYHIEVPHRIHRARRRRLAQPQPSCERLRPLRLVHRSSRRARVLDPIPPMCHGASLRAYTAQAGRSSEMSRTRSSNSRTGARSSAARRATNLVR